MKMSGTYVVNSSNSFFNINKVNKLEYIKKKKKLIIATTSNFAPFEFLDKKQIVGIDIDIIKAYTEFLGVKLEIKDLAFDSIINSLLSYQVDLGIAGITRTKKRSELVSFSNPYYSISQVIVVKKISIYSKFKSKLEILNALTTSKAKIGCRVGSTGESYIKGDIELDLPGIKNTMAKSFCDSKQIFKTLEKNKLDAIIIDSVVATRYIKEFNDLIILPIVLTKENYAIALTKDDDSLLKSINQFIGKIKLDGTLNNIINKYCTN